VRQIAQLLLSVGIVNSRTDWNRDIHVGAARAGTVVAATGFAVRRSKGPHETKIGQRVNAFRRHQVDASAEPAITAIRTAKWNKLLAPKTQATTPAVAGMDSDGGFVDEFHGYAVMGDA
jgi:hypothetical protein